MCVEISQHQFDPIKFHREVALKIQRFRIAEDEYSGMDEDEPWWKPGHNCETEPPSQRLTQRAPLEQGWPEEGMINEKGAARI